MVKNRGPMTQLRKDFLNFLESDPFFGVKKNVVPIRKLGEVKLLWKIYCSALPSNSDLIDFFQYPYHPCMVYLPTFGWCWWQMQVNMPYMDAMGYQFLFERSPFKPQKTNRTPSGNHAMISEERLGAPRQVYQHYSTHDLRSWWRTDCMAQKTCLEKTRLLASSWFLGFYSSRDS